VGGRGKCPGAPSHHLKEGEDRQNGTGKRKNRRPKRYRKKPYGKNGNGIKLKKKKKTLLLLYPFPRYVSKEMDMK
jgi:hypothetical protein